MDVVVCFGCESFFVSFFIFFNFFYFFYFFLFFFFQAEDGIRDLVRSRGLGDVYKRQIRTTSPCKLMMTRKPNMPSMSRA